MFAQTFRTLAGLTLALALTASARPAQAQAVTYSVSAYTATNGYVGTGLNYTGGLSNQTQAYAASDPASLQFGANASQQLYADVGAYGWATQGELRGLASSAR